VEGQLIQKSPSTTLQVVPLPIRYADREDERLATAGEPNVEYGFNLAAVSTGEAARAMRRP
jgi:hypothetical protein